MKKKKILLNPVNKITSLIKPDEEAHIWNFSSVGGVNRVNLLWHFGFLTKLNII